MVDNLLKSSAAEVMETAEGQTTRETPAQKKQYNTQAVENENEDGLKSNTPTASSTQADAPSSAETITLTADDLKNVDILVLSAIRDSLNETLESNEHREFGGYVEIRTDDDGGNEQRLYPDKPFAGNPTYNRSDGVVSMEPRNSVSRFIVGLFGWHTMFDWHTHPCLRTDADPPTYPMDYPKANYPSLVFTKRLVYVINPGAEEGQYIVVPTAEILPNWRAD